MGKIYYIMGKSSSGKDTIYKRLLEDRELDLKTIVPYTTRPIRAGETNGVEYFFADEEDLQKFKEEKKLIEVRAYNTFHGIWKYFTVNDKQMELSEYNYLMIGTLESYLKTKDFFGEEKLIPIMIDLDDGVRLMRALKREMNQKYPRYEELCRRFLADSADFSEENIQKAGIDKRFYNDELENCLQEISEYIKKFL
jgi:guanylate kinase